MTHPKPFRFGVNLATTPVSSDWQAKCRQAEDLGYDTITVSDYLDRQSPFLALTAAADATKRPKVGTFVLNTGFYRPALLARDVAAVDQLTDGRLELGLGTGYAQAEFEAADIAWQGPAARIAHLEDTISVLRESAQAPLPPLLIGGNGRRMVEVAAKYADIISLTGAESRTVRGKPHLMDFVTLSDRVAFARESAGERLGDIELNLLVHMVVLSGSREAGLGMLRRYADHLSDEDLLRVPTLLAGSEESIAEDLERHREQFGFSYLMVTEPAMVDFAKVMTRLR